jgi:hypothetical protein
MLEGGRRCVTPNVAVDDATPLKREQAGSHLKRSRPVFFKPTGSAFELTFNVYTTEC